MRLLLVSQDFPPKTGGIQTYSMELAKAWQQAGLDDFRVLTISDKKNAAQEVQMDKTAPFPIHRIKVPDPSWMPAVLNRYFRKWCSDLGITHTYHAQWQTLGPVIKAKQKGYPVKVSCAVHGRELLFNPYSSYPFLREWYANKMKRLLSGTDLLFSNSHYTAELATEIRQTTDHIYTTGLGVPGTYFNVPTKEAARKWIEGTYGIQSADFILVSLCRLVKRKGIDDILLALAQIKQRSPKRSFQYLIAGKGPYEQELRKKVRELDLTHEVHFLGRVESEDLNTFFGAADLFSMPARKEGPDVEGYGIVFLEAAAAGVPSVATRSGGIPDAVLDGKTGILVNESNVTELKEALEYFMNVTPEEMSEWSERAKAHAQQQNWTNIGHFILHKMNAENS